jgi:hypothetical protein
VLIERVKPKRERVSLREEKERGERKRGDREREVKQRRPTK